MSDKDALATIVTRNQFYRDGYRLLIKVALIQTAIVGALILCLVGLFIVSKPEYRFFATTTDGRIIQVVSLDQPYRTDVVAWATQAARNAMTFGYHDYRQRLQESSRNFTSGGWNTFLKAINSSRILEAVEARKLVVTGTPNNTPQVLQKGVLNGVYQWVVQMEFTTEYQGSDKPPQPQRTRLTLVIQRLPNLENPDGIGIAQWIQEPM